MTFKNKIIWITGASSGIGKATVKALAEQGAKLIISARRGELLEEIKASSPRPENIKVLPLDLERYQDFDPKVQEAIAAFGPIDILINNAGISQRSLAAATEIEVDERLMRINYMGTIALTKAVLPGMLSRKQGQIVTITSVVGKIGTPLRSAYAATKHALHGFFDSLRAEVHDDTITITLICPGFVNTDISRHALTANGSKLGTMDKATDKGMDADRFARKMLRAIAREKHEVIVGGALEKFAVYVKRFWPWLLSVLIRKIPST